MNMDATNDTTGLSLGQFRNEISRMKDSRLTRDEPLEPLSISMPIDHIAVALGASPYISLRSGSTSVALSHVRAVKRSVKGGVKSYKIICNDYSTSNVPVPVEYRLFFGE